MPARIVMVNGDKFVVDMEVDRAAEDILGSSDQPAMFEGQTGGTKRRVYAMREQIAYAESYETPVPMVESV